MPTSRRRLPPRLLLAGTLALAAAACTDDAAGPLAAGARDAGPLRATGAVAGRAPRIPNAVKYADHGRKPATGRAGSATLTARALQGRDGRTTLELTSGAAGSPGTPAGRIARVQARLLGPDGDAMGVINRNHLDGGSTFALELGHHPRGAGVRVQASVRGADPSRTGVVTVTETVRLRPDLSVGLTLPARAEAGWGVGIGATVTELNGEVGARADCVLYVDGVETDRAGGIWVDAGDAVTCYHTVVFGQVGRHQVEVRVEGVAPRDYDPSNNAASAYVDVAGRGGLSYEAYASQSDSRRYFRNWGHWFNPLGDRGEYWREWGDGVFTQSSGFVAWIPRRIDVAGSRAEVSQSTGGATLHSAVVENSAVAGQGDGTRCASHEFGEAGAYLHVCSALQGSYERTRVSYGRFAGKVTYFSTGYEYTQYGYDGTEYFYSFNDASESPMPGGPVTTPFGSDYAFVVRLTDGENTYSASPTLPLALHRDAVDDPWECYTEPFEDSASFAEHCRASGYVYELRSAREESVSP